MDIQTYTLIDGVARNADFPDTFEVPDTTGIKLGNYVKVGAEFEPIQGSPLSGERFWVRVTGIDGDRLCGVIVNDLVASEGHGLRADTIISFERRHVLGIE